MPELVLTDLNKLYFNQSPFKVSTDDTLVFTFDTTEYGGTPTDISQTAINLTTGKTVTANIITGNPTVSDDIITFAPISDFILYQLYAIDLEFTCGVNTYRRRELIKVKI